MMSPPITPPPRRAVAPAEPTSSERAGSFWNTMKGASTASWTALYKVADNVGAFTNTQTANVRARLSDILAWDATRPGAHLDPLPLVQLGTESFYPTSLDIECSKGACQRPRGRGAWRADAVLWTAARILRTLTSALDLPGA